MKTVYVVRVYGHPDGNRYIGKDGQYVIAPKGYQLMKFAESFGFATEQEAIEAPISYWCEGQTTKAEVVPLEVW